MFLSLNRHKKRVIRRRYETESGRRDDESFIGPGETLTDILTKSETSGSGSGLPLLVSNHGDDGRARESC